MTRRISLLKYTAIALSSFFAAICAVNAETGEHRENVLPGPGEERLQLLRGQILELLSAHAYDEEAWGEIHRTYLRLEHRSHDFGRSGTEMRSRRRCLGLLDIEARASAPVSSIQAEPCLATGRLEDSADAGDGSFLGSISGRLTLEDPLRTQPKDTPTAEVTLWGNGILLTAVPGVDGRYSFAVPSGEYTLVAGGTFHRDVLYPNLPCSGVGICDYDAASKVVVDEGQAVSGIDFSLRPLNRLRGRVDNAGGPLAGAEITAWKQDAGIPLALGYTSTDGSYEIPGLYPGSFLITAAAAGLQSELFDDVPCGPLGPILSCNSESAEPVRFDGEAEVREGVDFDLIEAGSIAGRVTDAADGRGIPFMTLRIRPVDGGDATRVETNANGYYRSTGLDQGDYYVWTDGPSDAYVDMLYPNLECVAVETSDCVPSQGSPVRVRSRFVTSAIDFSLSEGLEIFGRVTYKGAPLPGTEVAAWHYDSGSFVVTTTTSDADGRYRLPGLKGGIYHVEARKSGFMDQLHNGARCRPCYLADYLPLELQRDQKVEVLFPMEVPDPYGLAGRLTDADTGEPIAGADVFLSPEDDGVTLHLVGGATTTDENGEWSYVGLSGWSYRITARKDGYFETNYPGVECRREACSNVGDPVSSGLPDSLRRFDFSIRRGSVLQISLEDRVTGLPLEREPVEIYDLDGELVASRNDSSGGRWDVVLDPGEYRIKAGGNTTGAHLLGGGDCAASGCNLSDGSTVRVGGGPSSVDLNLEVVTCTSNPSTACFGDGRFRAAIRWRDGQGQEGFGNFKYLTQDSQYFWFFDRSNIEGVLKVLDACVPFERFWVFASGLTNVETTLWITDLHAGLTKTYVNPLGQESLPIQDTDAFAGCGTSGDAVPSAPSANLGRPAIETAISETEEARSPEKSCSQGEGYLCLGSGRFHVRALFRVDDGPEQVAGAVGLTDDSGYFWFFEDTNVEVLLKVLDGCALSDTFWVFSAGLTNVHVRLQVWDTVSGQTREYVNPQDRPFSPIQDTQAFPACF